VRSTPLNERTRVNRALGVVKSNEGLALRRTENQRVTYAIGTLGRDIGSAHRELDDITLGGLVAGLLPQPRCNGLKAACYFIASAASSNLTGYYASRRVGILLTSTERSACQASWDACIRSQDSGLPPNNLAILTDT
jgi:hypothetical protein